MSQRSVNSSLEAARELTAKKLLNLVGDDSVPVSELKDISERLKQIDAVLLEHRRKSRRIALVGSALALGVVMTVLASCRTTNTAIDASVAASAIELHFNAADELPDLLLDGIVTVTGIRRGEVGGTSFDGEQSGADGVRVKAREVRLQQLQLAAGSTLRVETSQDSVVLSITHPSDTSSVMIATDGVGEIALSNSTAPGWTQALKLSDVDLIQVSNGPTGGKAVPVRITSRSLKTTQPISLRSVDQASFTRPGLSRTTSPETESSIIQADVRVGPKLQETKLEVGDRLLISELKLKQMRIGLCEPLAVGQPPIGFAAQTARDSEAACPGLVLRLNGTVSDLQVAGAGPLRTLKPSWLEFFKDNALVGLLWAAAVFVWGTGWSIWKAFEK